MSEYESLLANEPFGLGAKQKEQLLFAPLLELTQRHYESCQPYRQILDKLYPAQCDINSLSNLPFIPVRLFKQFVLHSLGEELPYKVMISSGTSGQAVSRIFLNKQTAVNQQRTLVKIVTEFLGRSRMPMLIIDSPSVLKDKSLFSARGAGILGFSIFGTRRAYALNDGMQLDIEGIQTFLDKHQGQTILLFGFTFMMWQYFYKALIKSGASLDLSNAVLIHGGGWKKLADQAVSSSEFKSKLNQACGISRVHDYYGMIEQTGCIYMECEQGHLHASSFSDVIIRNPKDFSVCERGEQGVIQLLSALPESYPGHSILSDDEGVILGEDDCPCGRKGKYFKVLGRVQGAEIRGCSDTR